MKNTTPGRRNKQVRELEGLGVPTRAAIVAIRKAKAAEARWGKAAKRGDTRALAACMRAHERIKDMVLTSRAFAESAAGHR
jgi:hypothetical protein